MARSKTKTWPTKLHIENVRALFKPPSIVSCETQDESSTDDDTAVLSVEKTNSTHEAENTHVISSNTSRLRSSPGVVSFDPENILPVSGQSPRSIATSSPLQKRSINLSAPLPPLPDASSHENSHLQRSPLRQNPFKIPDMSTAHHSKKSPDEAANSSLNPKTPTLAHSPFDLRPPPRPVPKDATENFDIFSREHLITVLEHQDSLTRFARYVVSRQDDVARKLLVRYLQSQTAIKAVAYANAVSATIENVPGDRTADIPCVAAQLDIRFEQRSKRAFDLLLTNVMSEYITSRVLDVAKKRLEVHSCHSPSESSPTEYSGIAGAFCITDPSETDNPVIYASEGK